MTNLDQYQCKATVDNTENCEQAREQQNSEQEAYEKGAKEQTFNNDLFERILLTVPLKEELEENRIIELRGNITQNTKGELIVKVPNENFNEIRALLLKLYPSTEFYIEAYNTNKAYTFTISKSYEEMGKPEEDKKLEIKDKLQKTIDRLGGKIMEDTENTIRVEVAKENFEEIRVLLFKLYPSTEFYTRSINQSTSFPKGGETFIIKKNTKN